MYSFDLPPCARKGVTTNQKSIRAYLEQGIRTASSVDLLIRVFDFAIAGCVAKDSDKVSKALTVLEQGLDSHAFPELARSLSAIYRYCRTLLEKQDFGEVAHFLNALRDTFTKVKAGRLSTREEE